MGDAVVHLHIGIDGLLPRGRVIHPFFIHRIINTAIVIHGALALDEQRIAVDAPCQVLAAGAAQFVGSKYRHRQHLQNHHHTQHEAEQAVSVLFLLH